MPLSSHYNKNKQSSFTVTNIISALIDSLLYISSWLATFIGLSNRKVTAVTSFDGLKLMFYDCYLTPDRISEFIKLLDDIPESLSRLITALKYSMTLTYRSPRALVHQISTTRPLSFFAVVEYRFKIDPRNGAIHRKKNHVNSRKEYR